MTTAVMPTPTAGRPLSYRLAAQALDACRGAMVLCEAQDPALPIVYANPAFLALTGYAADQVVGSPSDLLNGPETDPAACREARRAIEQGERLTVVVRHYRRDGRPFWSRVSFAPLLDEAGAPTHCVCLLEDVSDDLSKDVSLQLLLEACGAAADAGTSFVSQRLQEALDDHALTGRRHALMELRAEVVDAGDDIDALRLESVRTTIATHLRDLLPARASMSSLEGLRFAVVLPLIGGAEEAELLATGLLAELPIPLECRAEPLRVRVAAGIAMLPDDGGEAPALLAAARAAAERGLGGAEPLQFVGKHLNRGRAAARLLEFDLHNALAAGQMRLVYQPQVDLTTGRIVGFEALLRWRHPVRGNISPAEFIPVVESCGMATLLTRWVMEQAVRQLRAWEDLGHHGLQVAVNAPASVFDGDGLDRQLLELLERHEIACNQVELELTERTLTDANPGVIERLQGLRKRGVSVAIDDFGTGYSNLSYLTRLPLDCLKIDLSFVQGAVTNPSDATVARMTCELARALKLRVVVEGIETEGQLRFFSNLRCDQAQGYLFSRPLEVADATALLACGHAYEHARQAPAPTRHLLLLDDEPNIVRSLRRVFRAQPWTVHTATTPDEAFELLARHPVGVVMSDQRMPLMRGTDFLARVKQLYPDTMRIVLSGYTELQSVTDAINDGAIYKFLTKPWVDSQLTAEIEQAFQQYEMAAENQMLQQRLQETNRQLAVRLRENEERLQREETALDVTHEALGAVPVPVLGVDASGMIALSNAAADALLGGGVSLVGDHLGHVLQADADDDEATAVPRRVRIGADVYELRCSPLGASSRGAGTVITLLKGVAA